MEVNRNTRNALIRCVATLAALVSVSGLPRTAVAQGVRVIPDRTVVPLGETLTVRIVLQGRFDDTRGPDLTDFTVVGKSSGSSISIVNGVTSQEQYVNLELAPRRAGNLTIGAVELLAGGKVVASSKPVIIRVSSTGQGAPQQPPPTSGQPQEPAPMAEPTPVPPSENSLESYANNALFLVARPPERQVYAGEPVVVEYILYSRSNLPLAGLRIEAAPKLTGFVVEQARVQEGEGRRVLIKGIAFDARVQWRGAVTALRPGTAVLDPMTATVAVGDFFGRRTYRVSSTPVAMDFKAVPDTGRPADFIEGTVGRFLVRASLDRTLVGVGESAVLTVEITGTGNLGGVKVPNLQAEGIRVARVPGSDLDDIRVDVGGISGRRTFQFLISADKEGEYALGRIELPFFDPIAGKYDRSRTEPLRLVVKGRGGGGPVHEVKGGASGLELAIAESPVLASSQPPENRTMDAGLLLPLLGGPVLVYGVSEVLARRSRFRAENAGAIARKRALKTGREAICRIERVADSATFWAGIDAILRAFIQDRFGFAVAGLTFEELRPALLARGVPADLVDRTIAELEGAAFGRFAPTAAMDQDRARTTERVRRLLAELDSTPEVPC